MKALLAVLLFAATALAQANPALPPASSACGPLDVIFDAQASTSRAAGQPEPGKALVYVVEDYRQAPGELTNPTLRVGLDGSWMGATRASSYIFFAVTPGEHHLCANWQSRLKRFSRLTSLARFSPDPGKIYYFRARIIYSPAGEGSAHASLDLEPVDPDEGQFLVSSFRFSDSHPRK